ncbi:hypothetical protein [Streptomyces adustus]
MASQAANIRAVAKGEIDYHEDITTADPSKKGETGYNYAATASAPK